MNACEEVRAMMSDALDGQLDEEAWQQLQAHIESCGSCWHVWSAFREVDTLLRATPMATPPAGFVQRATQAAVTAQRRRAWLLGGITLVVGGVLVALLLALATIAESGALYYLLSLPATLVAMPELLDTFWEGLLVLGDAFVVLAKTMRKMLFGPLFWPIAIAFSLSWVFLLAAGYLGRQLVWRRVQH